jgi:hypothetical protein
MLAYTSRPLNAYQAFAAAKVDGALKAFNVEYRRRRLAPSANPARAFVSYRAAEQRAPQGDHRERAAAHVFGDRLPDLAAAPVARPDWSGRPRSDYRQALGCVFTVRGGVWACPTREDRRRAISRDRGRSR